MSVSKENVRFSLSLEMLNRNAKNLRILDSQSMNQIEWKKKILNVNEKRIFAMYLNKPHVCVLVFLE